MTAAVDAGGFDGPASQVKRTALELDERGLEELNEVLASTAARVNQINAEVGRPAGGRRRRDDRARAAAFRALVVASRPWTHRAAPRGRSSRPRRRWRSPTHRSSRSRCRRSWWRCTRRSPGWRRSSACTRSCWPSAILPAERLVRRFGPSAAGAAGLFVFAAASAGCAVSGSLGPLLVFRACRRRGRPAGLIAAFDILDAGSSVARPPALAGRGTRRHGGRPGDRRRADRGARLARDLRHSGPDLRGGGDRLSARA